jgi:hypothetical protein
LIDFLSVLDIELPVKGACDTLNLAVSVVDSVGNEYALLPGYLTERLVKRDAQVGLSQRRGGREHLSPLSSEKAHGERECQRKAKCFQV